MIPIKKNYLSIAVFGIISTLFAVFIVLPLFKEIKAISQNLFFKKNKIVYLNEERKNLQKIENLYKTYQSDLERIENLFVDPEVPIEFIGFLEKTAAGSQIKLEISSMTKKTEKEELWQSLSVQLLITGSFSNFSKFLHKLENGPYLIETVDLNTRAAAKSKRQASFPLSLSRGESSVAEEEDLSSSPTRRLAEKDIQTKELENIPGADTTTVLSIKVFAK